MVYSKLEEFLRDDFIKNCTEETTNVIEYVNVYIPYFKAYGQMVEHDTTGECKILMEWGDKYIYVYIDMKYIKLVDGIMQYIISSKKKII